MLDASKIYITTLLLLSASLLSCSKNGEDIKEKIIPTSDKIVAKDLNVDQRGLSEAIATIKTVHGNITFKFYPRHAPDTVTRIIELIKTGFYDGIIFHRVIPNFVIQAGDPTGTGQGGSGVKLNAEFNSIQHVRGSVAMARAYDKDSADSQFYIALNTLPHLDGKYTIFGQVTDGMEILDKISKGDKILSMTFEL